jgi:hypothetical protein
VRRRTRTIAIVACLLWLGGIELLPNLHVALHDSLAPHTHTDGGIVFTVTYGEQPHVHADGTIHRPLPPTRDRAALRTHHGDGGLAHHAAAIAPVVPPSIHPLPIDRRPTVVIVAIALELRSLDPLAATARGPPRIA